MADLIEVTKDCTGCGLPTTYRTSKPVANVQCKHCGRGVYLGKQLIADARAALLPQHRSGGQTATAPLPDQSAEWARERPFTPLTSRPAIRPRTAGACATCGTATDQGSPRGAFVWCPQCQGYRYDAKTAERRASAVSRIDADELRARQARAAAAERARIDQAPALDLPDVLDLAGRTGQIRAAIANAIHGLNNAPTQILFMRAAKAAGRLQALDHAVSDAGKTADPYGALSELRAHLVAELRDAEQIAREIGQAAADAEISEALEARRLELVERRQMQAITAAPPRRRPAVAASWQTCQMPHPRRLIRPVATLTMWLSNSEYGGGPGKRLAICGQHDPVKVQEASGYSHYTASPIAAGR